QIGKGVATGGRRTGRTARGHRRRELQLEALEPRWLPASTLSLGDATVVEGDAGTVDLVFPVTRTGDLTSAITVGYTTADGTATAGVDYTAVPAGTLTIPA